MLRAGFSQTDITPGRDCGLVGYDFRQTSLPTGNSGVHDPLRARILVIEPPSQPPAVIVCLDLCILSVPAARRLRRIAARAAHTRMDRVVVACSHTHSGPFPRWRGDTDVDARFSGTPAADLRYGKLLEERVRSAVTTAAHLTVPVTIGTQSAPLGFAYNRRVVTPTGIRHCWNPQEQPELHPLPATDPTCSVVVMQQQNGPRRFILWSASAHPVVLGKTSHVVSADWPGAACAMIDAARPDTHSLFLPGPCGELHPWIATQESPANILPVARAAAGMVDLLTHAARIDAGTNARFCVAAQSVSIGPATLDLAAWQCGSVTLLAGPVELFNSVGATIRQSLNRPLIIATNTNGWTGYWPDNEAYDQGGYEITGARAMGRKPADTDRLVKAWTSLIAALA
jgi:hypothetical protein